MKINLKNILIVVSIIIVIALLFNIIANVINNRYYKSIVKENSVQVSKSDNDYRKIENILKRYFEYIRNKEYNKVKECSIFYADKINYEKLNNKLNLSDNYNIVIEKIYILSNDIYKCEIYT
ncbi:MAG: hypothetical protein RR144_03780, partial [Clostridia bacterium]